MGVHGEAVFRGGGLKPASSDETHRPAAALAANVLLDQRELQMEFDVDNVACVEIRRRVVSRWRTDWDSESC